MTTPRSKNMRWCLYGSIMYFLIFLGCNEKKKTYDKILPKSEMADIILASYLTEAKAGALQIEKDSIDILQRVLNKKLLEVKGIPDSIFTASYSYYLEKPEEMIKVIDIVIDTLSLQEQRMNSEEKTTTDVNDSLSKK